MAVETVLNTVLRSVPTVPITATAAIAISPAISPYSIAVTPLLSLITVKPALSSRFLLSTTLDKNAALRIISSLAIAFVGYSLPDVTSVLMELPNHLYC